MACINLGRINVRYHYNGVAINPCSCASRIGQLRRALFAPCAVKRSAVDYIPLCARCAGREPSLPWYRLWFCNAMVSICGDHRRSARLAITYVMMVGLLAVGVVAGFRSEPKRRRMCRAPCPGGGGTAGNSSRARALSLLAVIVLYKLSVPSPVPHHRVPAAWRQFTLTDVGAVKRSLSTVAVIVGALFGGVLMVSSACSAPCSCSASCRRYQSVVHGAVWAGKNYALMVTRSRLRT